MVVAANTTASTAAIWTICVVAVVCLAVWLGGLLYLDGHPFWRHWQPPDMQGPVLGGIHAAEGGRSVSPSRDAPATFDESLAGIPAQRGEPAPAGASAPAAQPAATDQSVPAQRSGAADHPEHSGATPGTAKRRRFGR
jgi:hypothetical protein